jgi:hydrogenase-1 operon protein HyaF
MSRLSEIPIKIEGPSEASTQTLGAQGLGNGDAAILAELVDLLERLASANLPGAIDLHSMPMSDADRARLQASLGRGEVRAFLDAEGVSEIQETAIPGIWWIQHRDKNSELIAEMIEVAPVPSILARANDEIWAGVEMLRARIGPSAANQVIAPRYGQ